MIESLSSRRERLPLLDVRKVCHECMEPFRCPTAQIGRFLCGPCRSKNPPTEDEAA